MRIRWYHIGCWTPGAMLINLDRILTNPSAIMTIDLISYALLAFQLMCLIIMIVKSKNPW